ncbi:MAG: hypothetical protein NUW24_17245, partial [Anaerolineae bacterium]|nr:hypothetical protein [Anaerolineae bacterium]
DPALGRWMQPDTLVPDPLNPQAWNRFSYVYNNPTSYVDPSGHLPIDWLLDIGGLAFDIYQLHQDPSLANWGWLALDVALWVLPFVPAAAGALTHADEAADLARAAGRMEDVGDMGRTAYLLGGGGPTEEAAEQVLELSRKYRSVEVVDIDPEMVRGLEMGLQAKGGIPSNVRIQTMAAAELGPLLNVDIFVVAPDPGWLRTTLAADLSTVVGQGSRAYVVSEFSYLADTLSAFGYEFRQLSRIGIYPNPLLGPSPVFKIGNVKIYSHYF